MSSLLLALVAGLAWTEVPPDEAAIFGAASTSSAGPSEDAIFGAASHTSSVARPARTSPLGEEFPVGKSDAEVASTLAEANDKLAIGGFLFMRLDYAAQDTRPSLVSSLASPSFADVYLDARPNDRLRAYIRGRLRYDLTVTDGASNGFGGVAQTFTPQLDQAFIKFDMWRQVFVTVGREKQKWGPGRFWNPTDFINPDHLDALSGVSLFDTRLGVGLVKLHLPIESLGWNFYAVGTIDHVTRPDSIGAIARGEFVVGTTEFALSVAGKKDAPLRLGASVSSGVWLLDLRAEASVSHGVKTPFLRGNCAPNAFPDPAAVPEIYSREQDWIPQVSGGVEAGIPVGDEDTLYVGAEYFYNDAGYADKNLYGCLALPTVNAFTPFYLGKHYLGVYALINAPGRWDDVSFTLSNISNLSDLTTVLRFDTRVRVLQYLYLNLYVSAFMGTEGGEFRYRYSVAARPELAGTITVDPVSGRPLGTSEIAALDALFRSGLQISPTILSAGAGLQISF
ncbi:MAG: hypothetical protein U1E65_32575 [Myxococcota bacterium]